MAFTTTRRNATSSSIGHVPLPATEAVNANHVLPPMYSPARKLHQMKSRQSGTRAQAFRIIFVVCLILFFRALSGAGGKQSNVASINDFDPDSLGSTGGSPPPAYRHVALGPEAHIAHAIPLDPWYTENLPGRTQEGDFLLATLTVEVESINTATPEELPLEATPAPTPAPAPDGADTAFDLHELFAVDDLVHAIRVHLPTPEATGGSGWGRTHRRNRQQSFKY